MTGDDEHPAVGEYLDPDVLDHGVALLVRRSLRVHTLRREMDHLALHSIPVTDEDGGTYTQVVLSTTLGPVQLADVLELLADLVREEQR